MPSGSERDVGQVLRPDEQAAGHDGARSDRTRRGGSAAAVVEHDRVAFRRRDEHEVGDVPAEVVLGDEEPFAVSVAGSTRSSPRRRYGVMFPASATTSFPCPARDEPLASPNALAPGQLEGVDDRVADAVSITASRLRPAGAKAARAVEALEAHERAGRRRAPSGPSPGARRRRRTLPRSIVPSRKPAHDPAPGSTIQSSRAS
jgi:hypothetical protein